MKAYVLSLCLLCLVYSTLPAQKIDEAWVKEHYTKKECMIPMRDGAKLFTAVYLPKDQTEKHPFLMTRTPYSCMPYGEDKFNPRLWETHWREYLKENYIFVIQDVRGRFMSEGQFVDIRPFNPTKKKKTDIDEASDTYDAVDWLVKNIPDNNGNVGVFGISYPGFYSTMAALSGHPAIKAVSPQAPVTEWFMGDDFHHNGALMLMDAVSFYSTFGLPRPHPTKEGRKGPEYFTQDNYSFFLQTGAIKNFSRDYMNDSIQFWKDLINHPNYDAWWKARDARRACKNIQPAMLVVGGLFDAEDCYGAWHLYQAIQQQSPKTYSSLVMGPWFHGGWGRADGSFLGNVRFGSKTSEYYQQHFELPFFQYYLKGKGNLNEIQEANIFFSGEDQWRQFPQWPAANVQYKDLYLREHGKLAFEPGDTKAYSQYTSDPSRPVPYTEDVHFRRTREYMTDDQRFANRRPDVLSFQTDVLNEDLTLAGPLTAELQTAISTTDADFVVKLIDVFPNGFSYDTVVYNLSNGKNYLMDGYQMLVRGEVMRGRYRNSYEKPEAFIPGQATTVSFELPDVAHTFKKGHRLMIQIQSTWFPLVDRNPQQFVDIYHCDDKDFITSEIKIFYSSKIKLPVLVK